MKLRPATPADIETLKYWDTKPHVRDSGGEDDWYDWDDEIPVTSEFNEILIAESEGRPIGVVQILDPKNEESHYWGDVAANLRAIDIWIGEEDDLGRGYGSKMMALALERCFAAGEVRAVLLDRWRATSVRTNSTSASALRRSTNAGSKASCATSTN